MKKTLLAMALVTAMVHSASADYNQTITAIFGSGNPDGGWTTGMGSGITLALRAKDRVTASTANLNGVYSFAPGVVPPNNNRAIWNWEFSINSGAANLSVAYDYYVGIDLNSSKCINYTVVNALTNWGDNSYGTDSTLNGQGVEGPAFVLATANNIAQQSQNLAFMPGGVAAASLDATWNYELFAVVKGAGPNAARVASVSITVVIGSGSVWCDSDGDGVLENLDECPHSDLSATVVIGGCDSGVPNTLFANGCTISDLIAHCAADAGDHDEFVSCVADLTKMLKSDGKITAKQKGAIQSCAGKSGIGN